MEQKTTPDQLCQVLQQTADVLKELTRIEQNKAGAASEKKHSLMDGFLHEQQALILKLRGLEQSRIRLLASMGYEGLTFRQILEQAEPALCETLSPHFAALTEEARRLKQEKETADRIIQLRLRELEFLTSDSQGLSYESTGKSFRGSSSRFKDTYV